MHPRVGAVHDVNIPAAIYVNVVSLDGEVADLDRLALERDRRAANIGVRCRGGNVVPYLFGEERIPDIDRPDPGVEIRDEDHLSVEDGGEIFTAGVGAEATAATTEVTAVLWNLVAGNAHRPGLVRGSPVCCGDIYEIDELAVTRAYTRGTAAAGLVDQDDEVTRRVLYLRGQRWDWLSEQREDSMCTHGHRGVHTAELWAIEVIRRREGPPIRRRNWTSVISGVQQFLSVDDLQDTIRPGLMTEIDAVSYPLDAFGPDGN